MFFCGLSASTVLGFSRLLQAVARPWLKNFNMMHRTACPVSYNALFLCVCSFYCSAVATSLVFALLCGSRLSYSAMSAFLISLAIVYTHILLCFQLIISNSIFIFPAYYLQTPWLFYCFSRNSWYQYFALPCIAWSDPNPCLDLMLLLRSIFALCSVCGYALHIGHRLTRALV